ncbi:hypothetical protein L249_7324 [Ophiocordyceps polyrhachis-furcata BCC 54312]|uniref:DUF3824 domain-containing protein n=1 Tax=Ophiocordyceps polyrhachis-furcata BCC 54312 TaxID=1330021 RepID=A0A367L9I9_9HYPO|nr:hypothetical protein L249_7324 [Ophiocordyceps polyrhachis-furcata BCC 54312]
MAGYEPYDRDYSRRYVREERRDDRYLDAHDYAKPYPSSRELVPRARDDDLTVDAARRRARSAEPRYHEADYGYRRRYEGRYDRGYDGDRYDDRYDDRYYDDDRPPRHKSVSKQDKLIAAVAGAALLVGSKELYDRHEAKTDGTDVQRNPLSSAALAGFGALAGYQGAEFYSKQQAKKDQTANYILHRADGHYYYDDDDFGPKEKRGHRNFLESAIAATGLGAAVKSLTAAATDDRRSDTRSIDSRSRSRGPAATNKIQKAAMASLLAGATEAFRVAKEPGGWKGEKRSAHGGLGLAESVIGGLLGNRLLNGSKRDIEEDRLTGRSRSRSRARSHSRATGAPSGLAALATAGLGAFGAKKALDRPRSRSRGRDYDSRSPSPDRRRRRSRSRSVVDKARNSLAKLGIGEPPVDDHRRRDHDDFSPDDRAGSRRSGRFPDGTYDDGIVDDAHSRYGRSRDNERRRANHGSASDLGDSDQDERKARKMKGKQVVTTGLATVATIHAAHGIYQSMEKRKERQKAVEEGRLSSVEAKRLKTKAMIQDATSVGLAVLGIKGAMGEMEEAREATHESARQGGQPSGLPAEPGV